MKWAVTENGMFLHALFPLIHLKGNLPLKQGIPVGLCVCEGVDAKCRTGLRKLQWPHCPQPPPPLSWVLSAAVFLGRYNLLLSFFNFSALRVIYLFISWMKCVYAFKCHINAHMGCARVVLFIPVSMVLGHLQVKKTSRGQG